MDFKRTTNFNLFLKDVDVVHKACEHFPDLIDEVHASPRNIMMKL